MPPSGRPPLGRGPTGRDGPAGPSGSYDTQSENSSTSTSPGGDESPSGSPEISRLWASGNASRTPAAWPTQIDPNAVNLSQAGSFYAGMPHVSPSSHPHGTQAPSFASSHPAFYGNPPAHMQQMYQQQTMYAPSQASSSFGQFQNPPHPSAIAPHGAHAAQQHQAQQQAALARQMMASRAGQHRPSTAHPDPRTHGFPPRQ